MIAPHFTVTVDENLKAVHAYPRHVSFQAFGLSLRHWNPKILPSEYLSTRLSPARPTGRLRWQIESIGRDI